MYLTNMSLDKFSHIHSIMFHEVIKKVTSCYNLNTKLSQECYSLCAFVSFSKLIQNGFLEDKTKKKKKNKYIEFFRLISRVLSPKQRRSYLFEKSDLPKKENFESAWVVLPQVSPTQPPCGAGLGFLPHPTGF